MWYIGSWATRVGMSPFREEEPLESGQQMRNGIRYRQDCQEDETRMWDPTNRLDVANMHPGNETGSARRPKPRRRRRPSCRTLLLLSLPAAAVIAVPGLVYAGALHSTTQIALTCLLVALALVWWKMLKAIHGD